MYLIGNILYLYHLLLLITTQIGFGFLMCYFSVHFYFNDYNAFFIAQHVLKL